MRAEGDALGRAEAVKGSNGAGRLLAGLKASAVDAAGIYS